VAYPRVQPDPPVRAFFLANAGGGGPVNLVLLGPTSGFGQQVCFTFVLRAHFIRIVC